MFTVTVKAYPSLGEPLTINCDAPITVGECVSKAVVKSSKYSARIGGEAVDFDDEIDTDTNIVLLPKQVKGNA